MPVFTGMTGGEYVILKNSEKALFILDRNDSP
jgi:hypothetical protein